VRYLNVQIVHWVEKGVKNGNEERVSHGIYLGLLIFFLKAFLFYFVLIYFAGPIVPYVYHNLPDIFIRGLDMAWWLLPMCGSALHLLVFSTNFQSLRRAEKPQITQKTQRIAQRTSYIK